MNNFYKSFSPLLKRSKKYLVEIILLSTAIIITIISLIIYTGNNQVEDEQFENSEALSSPMINKTIIFVDVSGAIKKPNLYRIDNGSRIKDAIDKAGGLSDDADRLFFSRNFNLARIVSDQEKIYIPSISEINSGIIIQNQLLIDYASPNNNIQNVAPTTETQVNSQLININNATIEELDQLPGVGAVTANKIITNRLYSTIDELLTKKVVNKGVYEKIRNLISL